MARKDPRAFPPVCRRTDRVNCRRGPLPQAEVVQPCPQIRLLTSPREKQRRPGSSHHQPLGKEGERAPDAPKVGTVAPGGYVLDPTVRV